MASEGKPEKKTDVETPPDSPRPETQAEKKLTSRYRGVCWNRKNKRWQSAINRAGRYIYLGSFISEEEAARAFDRAAVKLRGPAAKINYQFADYPAEMAWYSQTSYMGDTTQMVLKDPKLLRERVQLVPHQGAVPSGMPFPQPFHSPLPCNFRPVSSTAIASPHQVNILHGQVIRRSQGSTVVQSGNGGPVYVTHPCQDRSFERGPMPSNVFVNGENGMLAPPVVPYTSDPFHLSDPAVKAEPVAQEPPTPADTFLPVVNMPEGAELTQLYRGPQNEFAMGFVRRENAGTEVLLYDGRNMHEVGSFSTKDDAAQSCQALLKLLRSVRSTDSGQLQRPEGASPFEKKSPLNSPPANAQSQNEDEPQLLYVEKLEGKSPFDVPPGSRPCFDSDKTNEGVSEAVVSADAQNNDAQSDQGDPSTAPREEQGESLEQRMGSLLRMTSSLSGGHLDNLPSPQVPAASPEECRNESSMKISSSLSLINSGSLKNLLLVLNQSGNFSVFKKEGSEDEEAPGEPQLMTDLTFAPYDDSIGVETPTLHSAERSMHLFRRESSGGEDPMVFLTDISDPQSRKNPLEMEHSEVSNKKQKTCA